MCPAANMLLIIEGNFAALLLISLFLFCYLQATTGSGGWPLSVWLTPCLKPIFGGTYFPPDNRYYNRPGFKTLLLLTADKVYITFACTLKN